MIWLNYFSAGCTYLLNIRVHIYTSRMSKVLDITAKCETEEMINGLYSFFGCEDKEVI